MSKDKTGSGSIECAPARRPRGPADPIDAIPYPEVRAHLLIERAFDGLDDPAKFRLAGLVAEKYGPKPLLLRGTLDDVAPQVRLVRDAAE